MKRFTDFMEKLGENEHVVKCVLIFLSTGVAMAIAALLTAWLSVWPTMIAGGFVAIIMFANYGRLWNFCGPSLQAIENTGVAPNALQPAPRAR